AVKPLVEVVSGQTFLWGCAHGLVARSTPTGRHRLLLDNRARLLCPRRAVRPGPRQMVLEVRLRDAAPNHSASPHAGLLGHAGPQHGRAHRAGVGRWADLEPRTGSADEPLV